MILFNVSLWLADRRLVNFYEERWMPVLKPLVNRNVADGDFESSNEYRSSKDWDAFYAELLDESKSGGGPPERERGPSSSPAVERPAS